MGYRAACALQELHAMAGFWQRPQPRRRDLRASPCSANLDLFVSKALTSG